MSGEIKMAIKFIFVLCFCCGAAGFGACNVMASSCCASYSTDSGPPYQCFSDGGCTMATLFTYDPGDVDCAPMPTVFSMVTGYVDSSDCTTPCGGGRPRTSESFKTDCLSLVGGSGDFCGSSSQTWQCPLRFIFYIDDG